jgi:hypothetical protein
MYLGRETIKLLNNSLGTCIALALLTQRYKKTLRIKIGTGVENLDFNVSPAISYMSCFGTLYFSI